MQNVPLYQNFFLEKQASTVQIGEQWEMSYKKCVRRSRSAMILQRSIALAKRSYRCTDMPRSGLLFFSKPAEFFLQLDDFTNNNDGGRLQLLPFWQVRHGFECLYKNTLITGGALLHERHGGVL